VNLPIAQYLPRDQGIMTQFVFPWQHLDIRLAPIYIPSGSLIEALLTNISSPSSCYWWANGILNTPTDSWAIHLCEKGTYYTSNTATTFFDWKTQTIQVVPLPEGLTGSNSLGFVSLFYGTENQVNIWSSEQSLYWSKRNSTIMHSALVIPEGSDW